jgi:phosphoribosylformylglycinamidine synthase
MVGVLESMQHATPSAFQHDGDDIVLLGEPNSELGGSEYLHTIHGIVAGAPPRCDLERECALIETLLESITAGAVRSAHDCSDGGLAVALAECAMMNRDRMLGVDVDLSAWSKLPLRALLFGEAQGRAIVSTAQVATVLAAAKRHGLPASRIGTVRASSGTLRITIGGRPIAAPLAQLASAYHDAIPTIMSRSAARDEPAMAGTS